MARKKGDIALVGILAVLVLYPLIKFLEWVGSFWLFIVMLAGVVVAVLLVLLRTILPPAQTASSPQRPTAKSETRLPPQAEVVGLERIDREPTYEEARVDLWEFWCHRTQEAIQRGAVDEIRFGLQKLTYIVGQKSVSAETKEEFRQCVAEFAKVDPLYHSVMKKMRLLLVENPGLQQSHIYKGQSDKIIEQMRYVLYYAEVLEDLVRVKKGSSYLLYLPEQREAAGLLPAIDPGIDSNEVYELHREATRHKKKKDWDSTVLVLKKAQTLMRSADHSFSIDVWTRLPLVLQQAGCLEQSLIEFDRLLKETEDRCRRDYPAGSNYGESIADVRKRAVKYQSAKILQKVALAKKREEARILKLQNMSDK